MKFAEPWTFQRAEGSILKSSTVLLLCTLVEMSVEAFKILFAGSLHTLLPDEILHGSKAKDVMNF